jgi:hypothetical protein
VGVLAEVLLREWSGNLSIAPPTVCSGQTAAADPEREIDPGEVAEAVSLAQCRPHGAELGSCSECREQRRGFFEALLLEMRNAPSTGGSALPDMTQRFKALATSSTSRQGGRAGGQSRKGLCMGCCGGRPT